MPLLFLAFAATAVIALALAMGPLLKPTRPAAAREAYDRAVYRDQLKELEREVARGTVAEADAGAARTELQRRLLSAEGGKAPAAPGRRKPLLAAGLALAVVLVAGGIYAALGSPGLPDEPYAARRAERAQAARAEAELAQIRGMVAKLAAAMKAHPDDLEGWLRLGRSYAVLGQTDKAAAAFAEAEKLKPNDSAVLLTELQALMYRHSVAEPMSTEVIALLHRIQALDPDQPAVLWYLGLHAAQEGKFAAARSDWQKVLAKMPPGSEGQKAARAALDALKGK